MTEALGGIVERIRKVDQLVAEVATASREQNEGIKQVSQATAQMDKVTQAIAAAAEESAASSSELNSQAQQIHQFVRDLSVVMRGKSSQKGDSGPAAAEAVEAKPLSEEREESSAGAVRRV